MLLKFKRKLVQLLFLLIVFTFLGFCAYYRALIIPNSYDKGSLIPTLQTPSIKYLTEEIVINKIQNTEKIIPFETELSESIIIDASWGDLDLFRKIKKIQYLGKGSYSLDLSTLDKSQVNIDKLNKRITLYIEKPKLNSVSLMNDKTLYETTSNGPLRFGEIKLSAEELNLIEKEALNRMEKKMHDDSFMSLAEKNSRNFLEKLIHSFIEENIDIDIVFKID